MLNSSGWSCHLTVHRLRSAKVAMVSWHMTMTYIPLLMVSLCSAYLGIRYLLKLCKGYSFYSNSSVQRNNVLKCKSSNAMLWDQTSCKLCEGINVSLKMQEYLYWICSINECRHQCSREGNFQVSDQQCQPCQGFLLQQLPQKQILLRGAPHCFLC